MYSMAYMNNPGDVIRFYQDAVYRIAFAYCKNAADAEDITQEVFLRYLKSKKTFNDEEHLKAWLIRVTVNVSKSLFRSAWFKKTVAVSDSISDGQENLSYENYKNEEQAQTEIYDAVLSLPEKYRSVVLLYYYEDYSTEEIAKILRRTKTAIQTQLQRARTMLKSKLKEDWQNE